MKLKKYSLYVLAGALAFSSCKKQLNVKDPESIDAANAFSTISDLQLGLNGAYGRYAYNTDMYISALVSDEASLGVNNAGQGALTYRYQYSSDGTTGGDVTSAFFPYYAMIDQVNRVLQYVPIVTSANATEETQRDKIKGQLLALRAIAHFSLLELYCKNYNPTELGVPVMTTSDPLAKPARNTELEVITQIENDLSTAKGLLPAVTPATFTDTVMNKVNIAAYQARVALYKGDYSNAISYATEVISSGVKPISNGANFQSIWTDATANETLFRIRYLTSNAIGSLWTAGSNIYIAPSNKLVAAYGAGDIRLATFIGGSSSSGYYVNKFFTSSRGSRVVDVKACRIAEMYLIRAEAYAKKSTPDLVSGAADLNTLRANRITGYVNQSFSTSADLVSAILDERFKELCFEGFRLLDLKRNNLPVQRLASDASAAWQTLPASDFRFVMPIPQLEMNANPNMVQNSGY